MKKYFPTEKIKNEKIKPKRMSSLLIANSMAKSNTQKGKLYEKFLKHNTPLNITIKLFIIIKYIINIFQLKVNQNKI